MKQQSHCSVCPSGINREKRIAILRHALAVIKTPEAIMAIDQDNILAGLNEESLCSPCGEEVTI